EDAESLVEQPHDLHAQDIEVAVRSELEIVPQVEAGPPHRGDGTEARIGGALADDFRDALVAPEEGRLADEMREEVVELAVRLCAGGRLGRGVAERAAVRGQAVAPRVAQHAAAVELVEVVGTLARGEPHRAGAEE